MCTPERSSGRWAEKKRQRNVRLGDAPRWRLPRGGPGYVASQAGGARNVGLLQATPNAAGGDEVQRQPLSSRLTGH